MLLRLLCIAALLCVFGCSTLRKTVHLVTATSEPLKQDTAVAEKEKQEKPSIAVVPFVEKRGNLKSYGSVYKYLIPLVPYGTIRYERPDEAKMFNTQNEFEFNMSENLMKVIVDSVRSSELFSSTILTPTPLESEADLVLSGEIISTLYEGKTYSYGISFAGPVLWCLGLPAGSSHKELHIILYLKKRATSELLWAYTINKENTVVQGLYHNWGKEVNSFVNLMNAGAKEAIVDLRAKLSSIPLYHLKVREQQPVPALKEPLPPASEKEFPASETESVSSQQPPSKEIAPPAPEPTVTTQQ